MSDWRYLAQNLVTKEWLHTDLPLQDVELERALSAPGGINAFIAPELLTLRTDDGQLVLREWTTAIYAENGTEVRAGILIRSEVEDDGSRWNIECPGFSTYPTGITYDGDWSQWRPDPFDAVREIWRHVQSFPDGDVGMVVMQGSSGTHVGDFEPPPRPKTAAAAVKVPTKGAMPVQAAGESELDYLERVDAWEVAYAEAMQIYKAAKEKATTSAQKLSQGQSEWDSLYSERKKYELVWWEAIDCGQEIDRLATEAPFDWVERHQWDSTGQEIEHHIDMTAPMIGRRRHDLRFVIGENVAVVPQLERDGDEFANHVLGLGKGDGQKMIRSAVGERDGRLRRTAVVSFKDVGNEARLRALTSAELRTRAAMDGIDEIMVYDHPNAPLGSWSIGDEIPIDTLGPVGTVVSLWVRVVSETINPDNDDRIKLKVVNSEKVT
jgi:hypothetical protein